MDRTRELHTKILAVCPIDGVSIGDLKNKTTWQIFYQAVATPQQRMVAQQILTTFDLDAPIVPDSVYMWQARAALAISGKLDAAVAAVNASGDQTIITAWEYAPEVHRQSPAVTVIGGRIGLSSADLDALFISASRISV